MYFSYSVVDSYHTTMQVVEVALLPNFALIARSDLWSARICAGICASREMLLRGGILRYGTGWARLFAHARRGLSSALPEHKELTMPKVSPTMTHGRFIAWKKAEGEGYSEGEEIAEVESDKATMPIEAREDGFIARIFVDPDTPDLPLGTLLAITVEEEADIAAFKDYVPPALSDSASDGSAPPVKPADTADYVAPPASPPSEATPYDGPTGPAVARLLKMHPNIDLSRVTATGPKGRILKGDVLAAIENGTAFGDDVAPAKPVASTPSPVAEPSADKEGSYTDMPVSSMRRAIARRVLESKQQVPHQYGEVSYELDALLALRKRLNSSEGSPGVSVNDFVIRAAALALRRVPEMNVRYDPVLDGPVEISSVDISMAVAIPDGLILPVIFDADLLGLAGIAAATKDLATRAREGTLEPEEYEGGCFGVSNLGMFGIDHFSAIISPPQSGMLAVGGGSKFNFRVNDVRMWRPSMFDLFTNFVVLVSMFS